MTQTGQFCHTHTHRIDLRNYIPAPVYHSRYSAIPGAFIGTAFCILFGAAFGASLRAALRSFFRASLGTVFCIFLRTDISFTFAGCLLRTFLRFGFFGFFCFFGKSTDCVVPIYRNATAGMVNSTADNISDITALDDNFLFFMAVSLPFF